MNSKGMRSSFLTMGKYGLLVRDSFPTQIIDLKSMQVSAKLSVKWPLAFAFTEKYVIVAGRDSEVGLFELKSGRQVQLEKNVLPHGEGHGSGLLVNHFSLATEGIQVGFPEHSEGFSWYSFKTNRIRTYPHTEGKLGLFPVTQCVWQRRDLSTYLQLVRYMYDCEKTRPRTRSVVHCRYAASHSDFAQVEVLKTPRRNTGPYGGEIAVSCFLTSDEVIVVTTDYRDRIIGTDMRTGAVRFDKKFKSEFKANTSVCHIPSRCAVAVAIDHTIQIWAEGFGSMQCKD